MNSRIFAGVCPSGIIYADRLRNKHGDWARLALLPFRSLALDVEGDCPQDLLADIQADAKRLQSMRGEQYQISGCGQTVTLGG